jgi:hypothetical protein
MGWKDIFKGKTPSPSNLLNDVQAEMERQQRNAKLTNTAPRNPEAQKISAEAAWQYKERENLRDAIQAYLNVKVSPTANPINVEGLWFGVVIIPQPDYWDEGVMCKADDLIIFSLYIKCPNCGNLRPGLKLPPKFPYPIKLDRKEQSEVDNLWGGGSSLALPLRLKYEHKHKLRLVKEAIAAYLLAERSNSNTFCLPCPNCKAK